MSYNNNQIEVLSDLTFISPVRRYSLIRQNIYTRTGSPWLKVTRLYTASFSQLLDYYDTHLRSYLQGGTEQMGCHDPIGPAHDSPLLESGGLESGSHESSRRREAGTSNAAATSATPTAISTSHSRSASSAERDCTSLSFLLGFLILSRMRFNLHFNCHLCGGAITDYSLFIVLSHPFRDPTLVVLHFARFLSQCGLKPAKTWPTYDHPTGSAPLYDGLTICSFVPVLLILFLDAKLSSDLFSVNRLHCYCTLDIAQTARPSA